MNNELSPDYITRMERQKIYKSKNKEKIKAYQDQYRKDNPPDKEIKRLKYKIYYEKKKAIKKRNNQSLHSN